MSKEFHVFTHQESSHEQAFVFLVDRNSDGNLLLDELWLITTQSNGEVRSRVLFDQMLSQINNNQGGNIDEDCISVILDIFKDIVPTEKIQELERDRMTESDKLIQASEIIAGLNDESLERMMKNLSGKM